MVAAFQQMNLGAFTALIEGSPGRQIEAFYGKVKERPGMSFQHNTVASELWYKLYEQLRGHPFFTRINLAWLALDDVSYLTPDIMVVAVQSAAHFRQAPEQLEIYFDAKPLVIEVWSATTDASYLSDKLAIYRARRDRELWLVHPREKWLRAWRLNDHGDYDEATFRAGVIAPRELPWVSVHLDTVFARFQSSPPTR